MHKWTALTWVHIPPSAVRLGAIPVIVSVVLRLLMSIASSRQVHTIFLYAWAANGRAGQFQQLYGTRRAAATHVTVGMSPD